VYGIIGLLLLGPALSIAAGKEAWPFCAYQMFSRVKKDDSMVRLRLFGVPSRDPLVEIPLVRPEFIAPFDSSRLNRALERLRKRKDDGASLREAVLDCGMRYEKARRTGRHAGPPLAAVRLYELHWRIDRAHPDPDRTEKRIRLLEVQLNGS